MLTKHVWSKEQKIIKIVLDSRTVALAKFYLKVQSFHNFLQHPEANCAKKCCVGNCGHNCYSCLYHKHPSQPLTWLFTLGYTNPLAVARSSLLSTVCSYIVNYTVYTFKEVPLAIFVLEEDKDTRDKGRGRGKGREVGKERVER